MAKLTLFSCAPRNASLIALFGPATNIMCCLAFSCITPTGAIFVSPFSDMRTLILRLFSATSRSRIAPANFFCSLVRRTLSSTLALNSASLSKSNLASTPKNATAPKSMARFKYSVFKSTSDRNPFNAAATPDAVMRPPTKAPLAKAA